MYNGGYRRDNHLDVSAHLQGITSGLPDDSHEADEREEARRLRAVRARVKVARAVVSTTPGLAEALAYDWRKAARFYGRFGITNLKVFESNRRLREARRESVAATIGSRERTSTTLATTGGHRRDSRGSVPG